MPPKRKASAKTESKVANGAVASGGAAEALATVPLAPSDSSAVFERIKDNLATILGHPIFKKVVSLLPLGIGSSLKKGAVSGAFQEAFKLELFKSAMSSAGRYQCGINIMWLDFLYTAMPGIPLQQRAIDECQHMYFREPAPCRQVSIAVESDDFSPLQHQGALQKVSPGEPIFAFLQAVRDDIDALADVASEEGSDARKHQAHLEERLQSWKQAMLTTTGLFVHLASADDKWWFEHNMREEIASDFRTMGRTTFQKICEVLKYRSLMVQQHGAANVTQKFLANVYAEKAKMSQGSEPVTESFVHMTTFINETLFTCPEALECIRDLDARYGIENPLNGVTKLHAIAKASRDTDDLEWLAKSLWDHIITGVLTAGISTRDLTTSGRSLLQVYLMKKRALAHLLTKADVLLKPAVAERLRVIFANHKAYRTYVRPAFGISGVTDAQVDISYQSGWSTATRMFATFIEDAVYKHEHPYSSNYINCLRAGKSITELFEYQAFDETWSTIKASLDEEKRAEEATQATATMIAMQASATTPKAEAVQGDIDGDGEGKPSSASVAVATAAGERNHVQEYWRVFADNLLRSRVTLKVTPKENDTLTEDIKTSAPHAVHLQPGVCNLIVHYDTKLGSEANSRPASRKAPLRDVHLKSCITAARKALPPKGPGTLRPADVYVFQDQGRKMDSTFSGPFSTGKGELKDIHSKKYHVFLEFDSLVARRRVGKGRKRVEQLHGLHIFCQSEDVLPNKRCKTYLCDTRGDVIGPVVIDDHRRGDNKVWSLQYGDKKAALGDALRAVGGPVDDDDVDDDTSAVLMPDSLVPFAWLSFSKLFFANLLDFLNAGAVIDFTPGDGNLAAAAVEMNRPYLGFCHSEKHCILLYDRLLTLVQEAMAEEGNGLYTPAFVQAMKGNKPKPPVPGPVRRSPPKTLKKGTGNKGKTKDTGKKKKKGNKGKKESMASSSSSSPPNDDTESSAA